MKYRISKFLALVVGIEAGIVMVGWIFGIDALTRFTSAGTNMRFSTALVFFFTSLGLYFITRAFEDQFVLSQVALPGVALFIFLFMGALLITGLAGGQVGVESLFIPEQDPLIASREGMPSLPTAFNFILFGLACIFCFSSNSNNAKFYQKIKLFGYSILIISLTAVMGYVLHLPALYYQFNDSSIPMALNTALSFILLGCGLLIVSPTNIIHKHKYEA